MVVAAPPGGLTDIVARSASQFLQEKLGQPFVVENIAGASSTIGAVQVARSAPDGYTLLVNPSLFVITPMLMSVQYDVVKDFTPISNFGTVPIAVGLNPGIPAKNLQEFIALAKADPDKFTWGAEGVGAVGHLTMERIQREAGFKNLIVHYKGTSPALIDLIAGRVAVMVSPVPNMIEQFRGGTVRPVAVATKMRVSTLPDVPTLEELGFPNFEIGSWYGAVGPGQYAQGGRGHAQWRYRRSDEDAARDRTRGGAGPHPGRVELRRFRRVSKRRDREVQQHDQGRQHQDRQLTDRKA